MSDLVAAREHNRATLKPYQPRRELAGRGAAVPGLGQAPRVAVRVITPVAASGSLPGLIYLHGGGYVTGSLDSATAVASRLADNLDAAVIAVDYRLAPEHPYPAALDDSYAT